MQKIIEKIHKKFDTAGEKALAEAKEILAAPIVNDTSKIERFQKIGFTSGKPIKDAEEMFKKQQAAKEMVEAIEYYQMHYPDYKFIPELQIEKICKKYGLLYGESKNYLGDIPEKNLVEIESFKLREEDYYEEQDNPFWGIWQRAMNRMDLASPLFWFERRNQEPTALPVESKDNGDGSDAVTFKGLIPTILEYENKTEVHLNDKKEKPAFKICAPKKDFNITGYEVKDGYKLVYDPIVIQPVKYKQIKGGLIVSKWGLEGQDESLVNEKLN